MVDGMRFHERKINDCNILVSGNVLPRKLKGRLVLW
jgi:hypothetical protein